MKLSTITRLSLRGAAVSASQTPRTDAFDRSFNLPDGSRPINPGQPDIAYLESGAYLSALRFARRLELEKVKAERDRDDLMAALRDCAFSLDAYIHQTGGMAGRMNLETARDILARLRQ